MHTICLKDNWTLTVLGKNVYDIPETPIETKVPSTVYGTLLEKGLIPDPFYRDNELDALKLMENDFAYETEIVIGEEDRKADRLFLQQERKPHGTVLHLEDAGPSPSRTCTLLYGYAGIPALHRRIRQPGILYLLPQ